MSEINLGDCVTFIDESGCRRVGDVSVILDNTWADVRVPGFRDAFTIEVSALKLHAQPGTR